VAARPAARQFGTAGYHKTYPARRAARNLPKTRHKPKPALYFNATAYIKSQDYRDTRDQMMTSRRSRAEKWLYPV